MVRYSFLRCKLKFKTLWVLKNATKNIILGQIVLCFRKNASPKESKAEQYKKDYGNSPISRSKWSSLGPLSSKGIPQSVLGPAPPSFTYGCRTKMRGYL